MRRQGRRTSAAQPPLIAVPPLLKTIRVGHFASGLGAERGQHSLLTSDTTTLICSARSVLLAVLERLSPCPTEGAHAVLLLDRAGWHTTGKLVVPENITPIFLPSRAPELNPVENIWQYLRQNWLSNTVFENYDAIVDAACDPWRKLIAQPERITSIGMRDWAHIGQPS